jgi:hypothetical protein
MLSCTFLPLQNHLVYGFLLLHLDLNQHVPTILVVMTVDHLLNAMAQFRWSQGIHLGAFANQTCRYFKVIRQRSMGSIYILSLSLSLLVPLYS